MSAIAGYRQYSCYSSNRGVKACFDSMCAIGRGAGHYGYGSLGSGEVVKAKIVDPVFFDKEGARNV